MALAVCVHTWNWCRPQLLPVGAQTIDIKVGTSTAYSMYVFSTARLFCSFACSDRVYAALDPDTLKTDLPRCGVEAITLLTTCKGPYLTRPLPLHHTYLVCRDCGILAWRQHEGLACSSQMTSTCETTAAWPSSQVPHNASKYNPGPSCSLSTHYCCNHLVFMSMAQTRR